MTHLRLSMQAQYDAGDNRHPQIAMRELGIRYQLAQPQSLGDCWFFWNCEHVPEILPPYLRELTLEPEECLSADDAKAIRERESGNGSL